MMSGLDSHMLKVDKTHHEYVEAQSWAKGGGLLIREREEWELGNEEGRRESESADGTSKLHLA